MNKQLLISDELATANEFRLFGPATLLSEIEWPKDVNDKAMILFLSLPLAHFESYQSVDSDLICNIFMSYDPVGCKHLYTGVLDAENPLSHTGGGSKIIISSLAKSKLKKQRVIEPGRKIIEEINYDEGPYWLQDEINIPGMRYQFQLSAVSIAKKYPQLDSVFGDEEFYFFLSEVADLNNISGRIVVQMT